MTGWWVWFERLLDTDPHDPGCDDAVAVMHIYVDLVDAGIDAPSCYPGAAAHFTACDSCSQIMHGVMTAVRNHESLR